LIAHYKRRFEGKLKYISKCTNENNTPSECSLIVSKSRHRYVCRNEAIKSFLKLLRNWLRTKNPQLHDSPKKLPVK